MSKRVSNRKGGASKNKALNRVWQRELTRRAVRRFKKRAEAGTLASHYSGYEIAAWFARLEDMG